MRQYALRKFLNLLDTMLSLSCLWANQAGTQLQNKEKAIIR